jgi:hypothetical protein
MKYRLQHNANYAEENIPANRLLLGRTAQFTLFTSQINKKHNPTTYNPNLFPYTNISAPYLNNKYSILFTAYNLWQTKTNNQKSAQSNRNYPVADNSKRKYYTGECAEIFLNRLKIVN